MSRTVTGTLIAAVGLVGIFVAVMLAVFAFSARDDYGRIEIPGVETVHLEEGKIHVTYEEHTGERLGGPPGDLQVQIVSADGGAPISYTPEGGSSKSNSTNTSRVALSSFESPAEGDYVISAVAPSAGPGPNLQLGKGFLYALTHGVPGMILIGCGLLILLGIFVSRLPKDEKVEMPAA